MSKAKEVLDKTLSSVASEPYEHRGILHSEVALVIEFCRSNAIDTLIESGRARAQSTYMLAKYLPDATVLSVEGRPDHPDSIAGAARVRGMDNVTLIDGDGRVLLPRLIDALAPEARIAILLDGPKGLAALELLDTCFRRSANVIVGFIHDMRRLDHGRPSPFRLAAEAIYPKATFSDDEAYVARARWLDDNVVKAGGPAGPAHYEEFGSYGPTVGVFLNPENENHEGT